MKVGAWLASNWLYLLGAAGLGGVAVVAIVTRPGAQPAPPPEIPPPAPGAASETWIAIEGSPVQLVKGTRYRGCVQVPFVVPTSMVVSRLPQGLADRGFVDVAISRSHPSAWPDVDCDIFVECTWGRADEALERPGAVDLAWRRA